MIILLVILCFITMVGYSSLFKGGEAPIYEKKKKKGGK